MQYIDEDEIKNTPSYTMADFWPRVGATFIDALILAPLVAITYINFFSWKILSVFLITTSLQMIYKPLMEFVQGATLGKKIIGLRVISDDGGNISFNQSVLRSIFSILPVLVSLTIYINLFTSNDIVEIDNLTKLSEYFTNFPVLQMFQNFFMTITFVDVLILLFFYERRKTLHDIISRTRVIKVEKKIR